MILVNLDLQRGTDILGRTVIAQRRTEIIVPAAQDRAFRKSPLVRINRHDIPLTAENTELDITDFTGIGA